MDLEREVTSKFSLLEGQLQTIFSYVCVGGSCAVMCDPDGPGEGGDQQVLPA
jgi:hypothetical protein